MNQENNTPKSSNESNPQESENTPESTTPEEQAQASQPAPESTPPTEVKAEATPSETIPEAVEPQMAAETPPAPEAAPRPDPVPEVAATPSAPTPSVENIFEEAPKKKFSLLNSVTAFAVCGTLVASAYYLGTQNAFTPEKTLAKSEDNWAEVKTTKTAPVEETPLEEAPKVELIAKEPDVEEEPMAFLTDDGDDAVDIAFNEEETVNFEASHASALSAFTETPELEVIALSEVETDQEATIEIDSELQIEPHLLALDEFVDMPELQELEPIPGEIVAIESDPTEELTLEEGEPVVIAQATSPELEEVPMLSEVLDEEIPEPVGITYAKMKPVFEDPLLAPNYPESLDTPLSATEPEMEVVAMDDTPIFEPEQKAEAGDSLPFIDPLVSNTAVIKPKEDTELVATITPEPEPFTPEVDVDLPQNTSELFHDPLMGGSFVSAPITEPEIVAAVTPEPEMVIVEETPITTEGSATFVDPLLNAEPVTSKVLASASESTTSEFSDPLIHTETPVSEDTLIADITEPEPFLVEEVPATVEEPVEIAFNAPAEEATPTVSKIPYYDSSIESAPRSYSASPVVEETEPVLAEPEEQIIAMTEPVVESAPEVIIETTPAMQPEVSEPTVVARAENTLEADPILELSSPSSIASSPTAKGSQIFNDPLLAETTTEPKQLISADFVSSGKSTFSDPLQIQEKAPQVTEPIVDVEPAKTKSEEPKILAKAAPVEVKDEVKPVSKPKRIVAAAPKSKIPANPEIKALVRSLHVASIVPRGNKSKMVLGNRVYRIGDIISSKYNLRWDRVNPSKKRVYFRDKNGVSYSKRF